jgi:hypothetical protein
MSSKSKKHNNRSKNYSKNYKAVKLPNGGEIRTFDKESFPDIVKMWQKDIDDSYEIICKEMCLNNMDIRIARDPSFSVVTGLPGCKKGKFRVDIYADDPEFAERVCEKGIKYFAQISKTKELGSFILGITDEMFERAGHNYRGEEVIEKKNKVARVLAALGFLPALTIMIKEIVYKMADKKESVEMARGIYNVLD